MDYHKTNYRKNLEMFWKQFYTNWTIPAGFHVHHIKPKCTFEDPNDPRIHHPRNLIALHSDDHWIIHECRGDKFANENFILYIVGRKWSEESKKKMSKSTKGKKLSTKHKKNISQSSIGKPGTRAGIKLTKLTKEKMSISAMGRIRSIESRQKQSKACKGRIPWNKGKTMSADYKKNCSDRMKGTQRGTYKKIKKVSNEH